MSTTTTSARAMNGWNDGASNKSSSSYMSSSYAGRATSPLSSQRPPPWRTEQTSPVNGARANSLAPPRVRTPSVNSKGKQHERVTPDVNANVYDLDNYSNQPNGSNSTFNTLETSLRSVQPELATLPKRSRNSFFGVASDALHLRKFSKKKKTPIAPPPLFLPEVIEITATTNRKSMIQDTEEAERERLRDAAAQSIGLDPGIMAERISTIIDDESEEEMVDDDPAELASLSTNRDADADLSNALRFDSNSFYNRRRAGSLAHSVRHARSTSETASPLPPVPTFPTTVSNLAPFVQISAVLPKHYPAPSLLKFSLSKQWKNRYIIMTSPAQSFTPHRPTSAPTVSYLHLFKSHNSFEKEIERMEINEDSVVFVNENNEEIAGRRGVLRVGGVDCGAMRKVLNLEDNGRTMWLLQVTESQELQKWIAAVKNSVLSQRSVRAGLGLPAHTLGGTEPRGDMDVMLSIRAQGISSPAPKSPYETNRSRGASLTSARSVGHEQDICSSSQSTRSQANVSPTKSTVSALKGLFTGSNRPRSPSLAASSLGASSTSEDTEKAEESFGMLGNNLLTMLRTNQSLSDRPMSPLGIKITPTPPSSPVLPSMDSLADRKAEQGSVSFDQWVPFRPMQSSDSALPRHTEKPVFLGTTVLQPPPRRRPVTIPGPAQPELVPYRYINANSSTAESFGLGVQKTNPVGPSPQGSSHETSPVHSTLEVTERKPRVPSWSSSSSSFVSDTSGSASGSRRWSRQGAIPRMLTPPLGSPPPVPSFAEDAPGATTPRMQSPHPYAVDRSPSKSSTHSQRSPHPYTVERSPSKSSTHSQMRPQSVISGIHSFSKRASGASWQSTSTVSSHNRATTTSNRSSNRLSIPPPQRPAPNTALPPTPDSKPPSPSPSAMSNFRDSFAHRALRLSVIGPPKTPPSVVLPPRPDEDRFGIPRRSNSSSSAPRNLYPIPASPHNELAGRTPSPPPRSSTESNKRNSIKQRLRMLSAPTTVSSQSSAPPQVLAMDQSFLPSTADYTDDSLSSVHTRLLVGKPITTMQNDPSFLFLSSSPPTPPAAWTSPLPESKDSSSDMPVLASLSPPPWRIRRPSVPVGAEGKDQDDEDPDSSSSTPLTMSPPRLSSAISITNLGF